MPPEELPPAATEPLLARWDGSGRCSRPRSATARGSARPSTSPCTVTAPASAPPRTLRRSTAAQPGRRRDRPMYASRETDRLSLQATVAADGCAAGTPSPTASSRRANSVRTYPRPVRRTHRLPSLDAPQRFPRSLAEEDKQAFSQVSKVRMACSWVQTASMCEPRPVQQGVAVQPHVCTPASAHGRLERDAGAPAPFGRLQLDGQLRPVPTVDGPDELHRASVGGGCGQLEQERRRQVRHPQGR